ncbi:MAG: porin [Chromatiales bacterium]|jgi:predicted porin
MIKRPQYRIAAGMAALSLFAAEEASAVDFDFYASMRFHAEAVSPDNDSALASYTGWRDAYSRLGFNANHRLNDSLTAYGKLELPLDLANKAVQSPSNHEDDVRVAMVGVKGDFGDLSIGQIWMPYYNAIVVPFDAFSSYYSGFTTYAAFRKTNSIAYYSPSFGGLSGAFGYSLENGNTKSNGDADNRLQATLSYSLGDITLAGGIDKLGGAYNSSILGSMVSWQATDALSIAAKYEQHNSDKVSGYGADGDTAMNLIAAYTLGKNTVRATVAEVEGFGDSILHLGWDHQYQDDLKFFVEYYSEEETAAISEERGYEACTSCRGGSVAVAGLRFDFRAP